MKFVKHRDRPFVTIKIAQTFDGKIAAEGGRSRWITGSQARAFVHRLRSKHDAVLIGKNTFLADRPNLSSRLTKKPNWKIILGSTNMLPMPQNIRIFNGDAQVVFVVEKKDLTRWLNEKSLNKKACIFVTVKKGRAGGYDLKQLLEKLKVLGVKSLLVEGGGEVFWSFLRSGFADQIYWIMAPKVLGGRQAKTSVEGEGLKNPNLGLPLKIKRVVKLGRDYCFEAKLK